MNLPGRAVTLDRLSEQITIFAQSPRLDAALIDTVVTIPTFNRPEHLLRTVQSIRDQTADETTAIIVMENEATNRDGAKAVAPLFESGQFPGLVLIAHERGNCHAYNAGWQTALSLFPNLCFVAVLDDDEIASADWLANLRATSHRLNADFVGGPQLPVFEGNPPTKWQRHPVFTPQYAQTGPVDVLYSSGNLLIAADVLRTMPQPFLDLAFNFTGGGDADFMSRAKAEGFTFAWCNEAAVHETIPENRVTRDWITKRALRNGQLSAFIEHRARAAEKLGSLRTVAKSLILAGASLPRAAIKLVASGSVLNALYPVHIAAGRIASEFGYANEQYRNPED